MKYKAKMPHSLSEEQMAVYRAHGFGEKLSKLLHIRGIDSDDKIKDYFDFSAQRLHDPFLLKGMNKAVERINTAIKNKERILIIGDYDCDGISSTAILYKYLLTRYASTRYYLPNRDADGYGLTIDLVKKMEERFKPALIITVDCGISCPDEVAYIKSLGIDCIVTDHHAIPAIVPDTICINPKFTDQEYPFRDLAGAGVSLKLVQALAQSQLGTRQAGIDVALKYIDICALATVADIVPLKGENRVIVGIGLQKLNSGANIAITALAKSCNINGPIKSSDIGYRIGPKINAAGRLGVAKRGLDLLLESDPAKIDEIIENLNSLNSERQKICADIFKEADQIIEEKSLYNNDIIVVWKDDWEGGVLGIVSARIVDRYGKPAIVMSKSDDIYKGSARSVTGINMVETLSKFSDLLSSFGGHYMAAGLSVPQGNLSEFLEKIQAHIGTLDTSSADITEYDFDLELDEITPELMSEIEKLEPVGCENPSPSFVTSVRSVRGTVLGSSPLHLRFVAKTEKANISFMMFDAAPITEILNMDFEKRVLFEFQKAYYPPGANAPSSNIKALVRGMETFPETEEARALCNIASMRGILTSTKDSATLTTSRAVFVEYYKVIRKLGSSRVYNVIDMWNKAKRFGYATEALNMDIHQFVFCVAVFEQLGIITIPSGRININERVKVELNKSSIYNTVASRIV